MAVFVAFAGQALKAVDVHQGQGTAPDTAGVEGRDARLIDIAFQCSPVTEDDLKALGLALLVLEPGFVAWWCGIEALLALEVEFAFGGAKTHAGEIVGDH